MCFTRHELDAAGTHARARKADIGGPPGRSSWAVGAARQRSGDHRATLTGPSRTITVEPIVVPGPEPAPAPDRREEPAEPRPAERPAEEPVPTP
jgi:hypothetical protein